MTPTEDQFISYEHEACGLGLLATDEDRERVRAGETVICGDVGTARLTTLPGADDEDAQMCETCGEWILPGESVIEFIDN